MRTFGLLILVAIAAGGNAFAAETVLLRAGRVYPGDGTVIENGSVLVKDGRIVAVGVDLSPPDGAKVYSIPEGSLTAGLIDAAAGPGLFSYLAWVEQSSEVVPRTRVADAIPFESEHFRTLCQNGVTTIHVSSDYSSVIGARGALLKTSGPRNRPVVVAPLHGLKGTIGLEPSFERVSNRRPFGAPTGQVRRPTTRMGLMWAFRKVFYDALALRDSTERPYGSPVAKSDADLQVLVQVLEGKIPFRIEAKTRDDILRAVRLADEFGFEFTLEEGTEAFRCLDVLASKEIPVIYGPVMMELFGSRAGGDEPRICLRTPTLMADKGIVFALSARDLTGENKLSMQACFAMRFGLSFDRALQAVTTVPARLLGIDDRLGRVKGGYDADLVVWSGKPFVSTSKVRVVLIGGEVVVSDIPNEGL